jgi:hypothetical protein
MFLGARSSRVLVMVSRHDELLKNVHPHNYRRIELDLK